MDKAMATVVVALAFVAVVLVLAWPFMWMWNYAVVAAVTATRPIDYWVSAVLLTFIAAFITGSRRS